MVQLINIWTTSFEPNWVHELIDLTTAILAFSVSLVALELRLQANRMQVEQVRSQIDALAGHRKQLQRLHTEGLLKEHRQRRQLATGLHNDLMQILAVCRLKVSQGGTKASKERREIFLDLQHLLDQSLRHARKLLTDLSPTALLPSGLNIAIRQLSEHMERHGLIVTVEYGETDIFVDKDLTAVIYQIVRELLFNVLEHAQVQRAVVRLQKHQDQELTVTVRDQGVGFEPKSLWDTQHSKFGLLSISEQLAVLGGRFSLDSSVGRGTVATLVVPLTTSADT
jgi:signal transduction histidine kinase